MAMPLDRYVLTPHAILEMARRGVDGAVVGRVLAAPEQRWLVRPGRDVFQSRVAFGERLYLVRVFVDVDRDPAEVVTVYRTGNIAKYWRSEP